MVEMVRYPLAVFPHEKVPVPFGHWVWTRDVWKDENVREDLCGVIDRHESIGEICQKSLIETNVLSEQGSPTTKTLSQGSLTEMYFCDLIDLKETPESVTVIKMMVGQDCGINGCQIHSQIFSVFYK